MSSPSSPPTKPNSDGEDCCESGETTSLEKLKSKNARLPPNKANNRRPQNNPEQRLDQTLTNQRTGNQKYARSAAIATIVTSQQSTRAKRKSWIRDASRNRQKGKLCRDASRFKWQRCCRRNPSRRLDHSVWRSGSRIAGRVQRNRQSAWRRRSNGTCKSVAAVKRKMSPFNTAKFRKFNKLPNRRLTTPSPFRQPTPAIR